MNKFEFQRRLQEGEDLIAEGRYEEAVDVFDELDLSLIDQPRRLQNIAQAYERCKRYEDSEDILLDAREFAPKSRSIAFHLCTVALKAGELREAKEYYRDFLKIGARDSQRYVLQYRIAEAEKRPDTDLIEILEAFRKEDPEDKWMFQLANLYAKRGDRENAIAVCNDIDLWFFSGKYVKAARELREYLGSDAPDYSAEIEEIRREEEAEDREAEAEIPAFVQPAKEAAPEEPVKETRGLYTQTLPEEPALDEKSVKAVFEEPVTEEAAAAAEETAGAVEEAASAVEEAVEEAEEEVEEAVETPVNTLKAAAEEMEEETAEAVKEPVKEVLKAAAAPAAEAVQAAEETVETPVWTVRPATVEEEDMMFNIDYSSVEAETVKRDAFEDFPEEEPVKPVIREEIPVKPAVREEIPVKPAVREEIPVKPAIRKETPETDPEEPPFSIHIDLPEEEEEEQQDEHVVFKVTNSATVSPKQEEPEEEELEVHGAVMNDGQDVFHFDFDFDDDEEDEKPAAPVKEPELPEQEDAFENVVPAEEAEDVSDDEDDEDDDGDDDFDDEEEEEDKKPVIPFFGRKKEKQPSKKSREDDEDDDFEDDEDEEEEEKEKEPDLEMLAVQAAIRRREEDSKLFGNLPVDPDVDKDVWHFMVYGKTPDLSLECAREKLRELMDVNPNCPTKMLKISAEKIGGANIINSLDRFLNNMVIVESAGKLTDQQLSDFAKVLNKDDRALLIVFTDTKDELARLFEREPALKDSFTAVFEGRRFTASDLMQVAKTYLYMEDAKMTEDGEEYLSDYITRLLAEGGGFYRTNVKSLTEDALQYAEKGGFLGFGMGKVDAKGNLTVSARHFRKAEKDE